MFNINKCLINKHLINKCLITNLHSGPSLLSCAAALVSYLVQRPYSRRREDRLFLVSYQPIWVELNTRPRDYKHARFLGLNLLKRKQRVPQCNLDHVSLHHQSRRRTVLTHATARRPINNGTSWWDFAVGICCEGCIYGLWGFCWRALLGMWGCVVAAGIFAAGM